MSSARWPWILFAGVIAVVVAIGALTLLLLPAYLD